MKIIKTILFIILGIIALIGLIYFLMIAIYIIGGGH